MYAETDMSPVGCGEYVRIYLRKWGGMVIFVIAEWKDADRAKATRRRKLCITHNKLIDKEMKRIALIVVLLLTLAVGVSAQQMSHQPLTQFCLIDASRDHGAVFRSESDMARRLRALGFKVATYNASPNADEMATYTFLKASRNGTTLAMINGEDIICRISFATQKEVQAFIASMKRSGYTQDGTLYSHPYNSDFCRIYVRVTGKLIKIISPFEMLPSNF